MHDKYQTGIFDLELDTESVFHHMRIENTLLLLEKFCNSGRKFTRLLDVGCGSGYFLEEVSRRFPELELVGLDLSATALKQAAKRVPHAEFVLADANSSPFSPNYFDAILLNNILEHVPSPVSLVNALRRILSPDGCLVISTPSRYRFDNLIRVVMGNPVVFMSADHVTEYTVGQMIELLKYSGFNVQEVIGPMRKPTRWTIRNVISHYLIKPALRTGIRAVGSQHVLESTAFYMATQTNAAWQSRQE